MSDAEGPVVDPALGTAVDDAVQVVLDREPDADLKSVRSELALVTEDGIVCREGIDSALGEVAQHVATPENRLELTDNAFDAAREAAEPADDLDTVRSRLKEFEARYRDLEGDVDDLVARLDTLVERGRQPEDIYDLVRSIRALKWDTRDVHGRAEELRAELESFEMWANDPEVRFDELDGDVGHVEELLDGLAEVVGELEARGTGGDTGNESDPAVVWVDAVLQHRVLDLLVSDLYTELSDLRAWAERDGDSSTRDGSDEATARADAIETRIDDLRRRERRLGESLAALVRPSWREQFEGRIEAFETALDAFDPPVQWGAVRDVLEEYRAALTDGHESGTHG